MRTVEWSAEALQDFRSAIDFIAQRSEVAAMSVAQRILKAIDLLGELPTGHQGRLKGIYEKPVQRTPCIIAYAMSDRMLYVLRIVHGSRDWPEGEWPAE